MSLEMYKDRIAKLEARHTVPDQSEVKALEVQEDDFALKYFFDYECGDVPFGD